MKTVSLLKKVYKDVGNMFYVRYGYWCSVLSRLRLPRFRSEQFANRAVKSPRLRAGKKLTIFVFPRLRKNRPCFRLSRCADLRSENLGSGR